MTQLRVLFFGKLADLAGAERPIDSHGLTDVASAIAVLTDAMPAIAPLLHPEICRYVLDQQIVPAGAPLAGASELAFLPPVSGG